jgi:hypothetical protein
MTGTDTHPDPDPEARARAVKRACEADWLAVPGVVAVGVGTLADGRIGVVISVAGDGARARIPAEVDGVPVEVAVTGTPRAL